VQNFMSAAVGMAVLVALTRAFKRKHADTVGNFWVDLTRSTIYILVPLAIVTALALVWQGVPQTTHGKETAALLDAQPGTPPTAAPAGTVAEPITEQGIAVGPVASQVAIKQLGTNGGGFYNVNSAHPLENPTPLANFIECIAILLIPAALCFTFGRMVGSRRQGAVLLIVMTLLVAPFLALTLQQEQAGNPALASISQIDQTPSRLQAGGNMEGKETRFGISASALWANATTAASNGSVNSMHDSYTPLGGMSPIVLMALGEVAFGGVGSGLYGMLMFALIAVFVAGLMIGRTPEYLGKKIEAFEVKMASVAILLPPLVVLVGTAIAVLVEPGKAGTANPGAHGFSEILYAFSSAGNNNGSAFAGLSANTPFYNTALGLAMLLARYWLLIPVLAVRPANAEPLLLPCDVNA